MISPKQIASIIPVNMTTKAAPQDDIAPQMWSFAGCLGQGLNFWGCRLFLKHSLPWCSNCIIHSSVNITLLKFSSTLSCSLHHTNLLSLFRTLISWQWCSLVHIHPSCLRWSFIVKRETFSAGYFSINVLRNCLAVASSFFLILYSSLVWRSFSLSMMQICILLGLLKLL